MESRTPLMSDTCSDSCLNAPLCLVVVEPTERKPGRGESPPAGPNSDSDATESHVVGADHGKQGPVPCGAKTIHVKASNGCSEIATLFFSPMLSVSFMRGL